MIPFRVSVVASIAAAIFLLVIFELIRSRGCRSATPSCGSSPAA